MADSILDTTKKVLGIDPTYTAFDLDITMFINSALSELHQLGVGPANGFEITGKDQVWLDFLNSDPTLNDVKAYVFLRVRLLFDPPSTAYLVQAFESQLQELAFRINVRREELKYPWDAPVVMGRSNKLNPNNEDEVDWG